jgi:hypothetical protein
MCSFTDGADFGSAMADLFADAPDEAVVEFSGTDLGLVLALGHEWHWTNATLGVEWLGLYVPVVPRSAKVTRGADDGHRHAVEAPPGDHQVDLGFRCTMGFGT